MAELENRNFNFQSLNLPFENEIYNCRIWLECCGMEDRMVVATGYRKTRKLTCDVKFNNFPTFLAKFGTFPFLVNHSNSWKEIPYVVFITIGQALEESRLLWWFSKQCKQFYPQKCRISRILNHIWNYSSALILTLKLAGNNNLTSRK